MVGPRTSLRKLLSLKLHMATICSRTRAHSQTHMRKLLQPPLWSLDSFVQIAAYVPSVMDLCVGNVAMGL
jgi:hypothetical protein